MSWDDFDCDDCVYSEQELADGDFIFPALASPDDLCPPHRAQFDAELQAVRERA